MPFKDLVTHKNLAVLLVSYTIYTDSKFAVFSAIGQLFVAEIRPGTTEYTLYSLTSGLFSLSCMIAFLWIRPRLSLRLESWLIIGYALILIIPIWASIGLSNVNFGFKVRKLAQQSSFIALISSYAFATKSLADLELEPMGVLRAASRIQFVRSSCTRHLSSAVL